MRRAHLPIVAATALYGLACGARTGSLDEGLQPSPAADSGAPTDSGSKHGDASPACGLVRSRVFLTSTLHDGNLGGVRGADAVCIALAHSAGLGGAWRAWLSDRATSARDHIYPAPGGYVLLDRTVVALSLEALVSGSIAHAIDQTEAGLPIVDGNTEVWTGTSGSGDGANSDPCADGSGNDWSSNDIHGAYPFVGHSNATDGTWTAVYLQYCNRTNVRLYCFEACD